MFNMVKSYGVVYSYFTSNIGHFIFIMSIMLHAPLPLANGLTLAMFLCVL